MSRVLGVSPIPADASLVGAPGEGVTKITLLASLAERSARLDEPAPPISDPARSSAKRAGPSARAAATTMQPIGRGPHQKRVARETSGRPRP